MENSQQDVEIFDIKAIVIRGLFLFIIPCISFIYPALNKATGKEKVMVTFIDYGIPFLPPFIIAYLSWYFYVCFYLIYVCIFDKEVYIKLLISLIAGMLISYWIFSIFPTYVIRPKVYGKDIFSKLLLILYQRDNPYNCFPSIHVLNSLLIAMYVCDVKRFKLWEKVTSIVIAIFIILSTMFIKQHYFVDVLAAIIMAYILYFLVGKLYEIIEIIHNIKSQKDQRTV